MGNRPSDTIFAERLTPESLGKLFALCEPNVFTQGMIWKTRSFGQWVVELSKAIAQRNIGEPESVAEPDLKLESSTNALIHRCRKPKASPEEGRQEGAPAMIDAQNYRVDEQLKDGTPVTIRAIRPDDRKRILKAFKNLEPESIYTRFFSHKSTLTEKELKSITEVDFENTVALVVTIPAGGGEETIIGGGRYVLYDPPNTERSAEIAFTVEEDYQGQGIASQILRHLIHIAREKGVAQFEAIVLRENTAMLAVLARSGLPIKQSFEDGALHAVLSLSAQES